jgi:hypothetical protein
MNNEQHREDTKYLQWQDGMYVMLDALLCDYEKALVEDSLRNSVYEYDELNFKRVHKEDCLGVSFKFNPREAGLWCAEHLKIKLTRAQALYIATGDTDI